MRQDQYVWVIAAPGLVVPVERGRRARYSADSPQRVKLTQYIRRRIADGELREVKEPKPESKSQGKG